MKNKDLSPEIKEIPESQAILQASEDFEALFEIQDAW